MDRETNIRSCLDSLNASFDCLEISSVYESEAVGFDGDNFYNLIAVIRTELSISALSSVLKNIEDLHGRDRSGPKFGARTLDIDIVCYGNLVGVHEGIELPRPELYYNAFVMLPMRELASTERDPKTEQTYQQLWDELNSDQKLWKVNFDWPSKLTSQG